MTCNICGGNAGRISPDGAHFLCAARKSMRLPTPCLGFKCPTCEGRGHTARKTTGVAMFFDAGPAAISQSINAVFPECPTCEGRGSVTTTLLDHDDGYPDDTTEQTRD